jgi:Domain of unknown function (DUF3883)
VGINTWWADNPEQRYWMEITSRDVLGENLLAPQVDGAGRTQWSYSLVSHVRPGDRVLHYQTNAPGGGAVVGWSQAVGDVSVGTITWQARGTQGRARGHATTGPSWFVPLGGMHELDTRVRGGDLAGIESALLKLREDLETKHGKPVYFPFFQYRPGEIRAQQSYLVKFPVELFDVLPDLAVVKSELVGDVESKLPEDKQSPTTKVPRGRLTRVQDPLLRAAIERRSLDVAIKHYKGLGADEPVEIGKPYDIQVTINGEERHIEVKGSSLLIGTVELTINEVVHAADFQPTDLVVVDGIRWRRMADGTIKTRGGRLRVWSDWTPLDRDLSARKFAYYLPGDDVVAD